MKRHSKQKCARLSEPLNNLIKTISEKIEWRSFAKIWTPLAYSLTQNLLISCKTRRKRQNFYISEAVLLISCLNIQNRRKLYLVSHWNWFQQSGKHGTLSVTFTGRRTTFRHLRAALSPHLSRIRTTLKFSEIFLWFAASSRQTTLKWEKRTTNKVFSWQAGLVTWTCVTHILGVSLSPQSQRKPLSYQTLSLCRCSWQCPLHKLLCQQWKCGAARSRSEGLFANWAPNEGTKSRFVL